MNDNKNNPSEPQPLADEELASVSGGAIPKLIMDYYEMLVPEGMHAEFDAALKEDEGKFLGLLYNQLGRDDHTKAQVDVGFYIQNGELPNPYGRSAYPRR